MSIVTKETQAESGFFRSKVRDLARTMRTPRSALLFAVQSGMAFVPIPGAGQGFSAINSMLADVEFSARATALLSLATDRSAEIRPLIEESFADGDWSMRAAAAQSASLRNERIWQPRLAMLFSDTNRKVRYRAAAVYIRLNRLPGTLSGAARFTAPAQ
jgi:hypothetical protein